MSTHQTSPMSMADLFRMAEKARAREDANTLSDTDPYDASLGEAAEAASAAVLNREPERLADLLILAASVRLAVEDLDQWIADDPAAMAMHDNLKKATGNIARFLVQKSDVDVPADLATTLERIATGVLYDEFEAADADFCERLTAVGGDYLRLEESSQ